MKNKLGATALSAALISGLVLSGNAAQATEISEEVISAPAQSSETASAPTETSAPEIESEASSNESAAEESAIDLAESEATAVAEEPVASPTPAPSVEVIEAEPAESESAGETEESVTTDSERVGAHESVAASEAPAEPGPSLESTESEKDVAVEDEDPRWEQLEALMPEGSGDWDEAQWEEFDNTEAGQELNRLHEELMAEESFLDDEFELSDEEMALWDSFNKLLPEEFLEWDEEQWVQYFQTENGLELLDLILPFVAESIESDGNAADLQALFEEVFANDPELLAYYLELYFGIQQGDEEDYVGPETEVLPAPSEGERPTEGTKIQPAGEVSKSPVAHEKSTSKVAAEAAPRLANTGFSGFVAAGVGLLLALAGAVLTVRSRKASANYSQPVAS
ncbi:hypothetical protein [Glutamicibacter sp. JC586]|uniref:hypothetical protein n=1 Tax=Glutamicibacter sp. JC586 TaxID=2590552 RepID=UPI001359F49D|nr:hypothetical protein [Glutamicibacter sp. JC586]